MDSAEGNALYSLLMLLGLAAIFVTLQKRGPISRNLTLGLGALTGLRVASLIAFAQNWLADTDGYLLLAPLERSVHLISIVVFAWLWLARERDILSYGLALGSVFFGGGLTLLGRVIPTFNYSLLDYAWSLACLLMLALATVRLQRAGASSNGLRHMGLLALGQVLHAFLAEPFGSIPFLVEGATLVSLPLLLRVPISARPRAETSLPEDELEQGSELPDFLDFDDLSESSSDAGTRLLDNELAKNIAVRFNADLCILAAINDAQQTLEAEQAYNGTRSSGVAMAAIRMRDLPRLTAALERGRSLRLPAEDHVAELAEISASLGLPNPAHLLAVPFQHPKDLRRWAILLLNHEKEWSLENEVAVELMASELSSQLSGLNGGESQFIAEPGRAKTIDESLDEAELLRAENQKLREELQRLSEYIQSLKTDIPGEGSIDAMIQSLKKENEELKGALDSLMQGGLEPDVAKEELRLALEELANHQARLDVAQNALVEAKLHEAASNITVDQVELIASIAQELRQPLSSIWGYTDLLLAESVGILGALQQKFLERVRNSTDRMNTLIEDLIRIVELEHTMNNLYGKPVNLAQVIEEGVRQIQSQVKEKEVEFTVDVVAELPELNTDRDAVQQIIYHLLQNALDATPPQGSILMRAFRESQPELGDYVLIRIKDSGGGIPEEHLSRVFSRIYRSTNPVIEGVGDTGVGLSIAETLTRALGGRIWVESDRGVGSAFNVLLPIRPEEQPDGNN
ncbi:MAG: ATP-binding protein [Anaerolineales bacterium]